MSQGSTLQDASPPLQQKRKKKHQAKKNAAAKKSRRFSATEDVVNEDALGVEEMGSALQIARHPPKPSRSKQNQGQKTDALVDFLLPQLKQQASSLFAILAEGLRCTTTESPKRTLLSCSFERAMSGHIKKGTLQHTSSCKGECVNLLIFCASLMHVKMKVLILLNETATLCLTTLAMTKSTAL